MGNRHFTHPYHTILHIGYTALSSPYKIFAVRKATAYLSETTGMKVHIGRLRLTFLFDIDLQDVQIKDGQDDSLLDVERLSVDLSFASLLHGEIDVEGIELTRAAVNTKSMIAGWKSREA